MESAGWKHTHTPNSQSLNVTRETRIYLQHCENKCCQALGLKLFLYITVRVVIPKRSLNRLQCVKNCLGNYLHENK